MNFTKIFSNYHSEIDILLNKIDSKRKSKSQLEEIAKFKRVYQLRDATPGTTPKNESKTGEVKE